MGSARFGERRLFLSSASRRVGCVEEARAGEVVAVGVALKSNGLSGHCAIDVDATNRGDK